MHDTLEKRSSFISSSRAHLDTKPLHSDDSDEDPPGVGDYTVYECPGLAPVSQVLSSLLHPLLTNV